MCLLACSLVSYGCAEPLADMCLLQGSPHWDNNFCKAGEEQTLEKAANAQAVPVPDSDPIFGVGGPLVVIWQAAKAKGWS